MTNPTLPITHTTTENVLLNQTNLSITPETPSRFACTTGRRATLFKELIRRKILDNSGKLLSQASLPALHSEEIAQIENLCNRNFQIPLVDSPTGVQGESVTISINTLLKFVVEKQGFKGNRITQFELCGGMVPHLLCRKPGYVRKVFCDLGIDDLYDPELLKPFSAIPKDFDFRMRWRRREGDFLSEEDFKILEVDLLSTLTDAYCRQVYRHAFVDIHRRMQIQKYMQENAFNSCCHIMDGPLNFAVFCCKGIPVDFVFVSKLPRSAIFTCEELFLPCSTTSNEKQLVVTGPPSSHRGSAVEALLHLLLGIVCHEQLRVESKDLLRFSTLVTRGGVPHEKGLTHRLYTTVEGNDFRLPETDPERFLKNVQVWQTKHLHNPVACFFFVLNLGRVLHKEAMSNAQIAYYLYKQLNPLKSEIEKYKNIPLKLLHTLLLDLGLPFPVVMAFVQMTALLVPTSSTTQEGQNVSVDWVEEEGERLSLQLTLLQSALLLDLKPLQALQILINFQKDFPLKWQRAEPYLSSFLLHLVALSSSAPKTHGEWLEAAKIDLTQWRARSHLLLDHPSSTLQLLALFTLRTLPDLHLLALCKEAEPIYFWLFMHLPENDRALLYTQLQRFLEPSVLPNSLEECLSLDTWYAHFMQQRSFESAYFFWKQNWQKASESNQSPNYEIPLSLLLVFASSTPAYARQIALQLKEDLHWGEHLRRSNQKVVPFIHDYWEKHSPSFETMQGAEAAALMEVLLKMLLILLPKTAKKGFDPSKEFLLSPALLIEYVGFSEKRRCFGTAFRLAFLGTFFLKSSEQQKNFFWQHQLLNYWRQEIRKPEEEKVFLIKIVKTVQSQSAETGISQILRFLAARCSLESASWQKLFLVLFTEDPQGFLAHYRLYKTLPLQLEEQETVMRGIVGCLKAQTAPYERLYLFSLYLSSVFLMQKMGSEEELRELMSLGTCKQDSIGALFSQLLVEKQLPFIYLEAFLQVVALLLYREEKSSVSQAHTVEIHSEIALLISGRYLVLLSLNLSMALSRMHHFSQEQPQLWQAAEPLLYQLCLKLLCSQQEPSLDNKFSELCLEKVQLRSEESQVIQMVAHSSPLLRFLGLLLMARLPAYTPTQLTFWGNRVGLSLILNAPNKETSQMHRQLQVLTGQKWPLAETALSQIEMTITFLSSGDESNAYKVWKEQVHLETAEALISGALSVRLFSHQALACPLFGEKMLGYLLKMAAIERLSLDMSLKLMEWIKKVAPQVDPHHSALSPEKQQLFDRAVELFITLLSRNWSSYKQQKKSLPTYDHWKCFLNWCEERTPSLFASLVEKGKIFYAHQLSATQISSLQLRCVQIELRAAEKNKERSTRRELMVKGYTLSYRQSRNVLDQALSGYFLEYTYEEADQPLFAHLITWFQETDEPQEKKESPIKGVLSSKSQIVVRFLEASSRDLGQVFALLETLSEEHIEPIVALLVDFLQCHRYKKQLLKWLESTSFFRRLSKTCSAPLSSCVALLVYNFWKASYLTVQETKQIQKLVEKYPETFLFFKFEEWKILLVSPAWSFEKWKWLYHSFLTSYPYTPDCEEMYLEMHYLLMKRALATGLKDRLLFFIEGYRKEEEQSKKEQETGLQVEKKGRLYTDLLISLSAAESFELLIFLSTEKGFQRQSPLLWDLFLKMDPTLESVRLHKETPKTQIDLYHRWIKQFSKEWPLKVVETLHQELYSWLRMVILSQETEAKKEACAKQVTTDYHYVRFLLATQKDDTLCRQVIEERMATIQEPIYWEGAGTLLSYLGEKDIVLLGLLHEALSYVNRSYNHTFFPRDINYQSLIREIKKFIEKDTCFSPNVFDLINILFLWIQRSGEGRTRENGVSMEEVLRIGCKRREAVHGVATFLLSLLIWKQKSDAWTVGIVFGDTWLHMCLECYSACLEHILIPSVESPILLLRWLNHLCLRFWIDNQSELTTHRQWAFMVRCLMKQMQVMLLNWRRLTPATEVERQQDLQDFQHLISCYSQIQTAAPRVSVDALVSQKAVILTPEIFLKICETDFKFDMLAFSIFAETPDTKPFFAQLLMQSYNKLCQLVESLEAYQEIEQQHTLQTLFFDALQLAQQVTPLIEGGEGELSLYKSFLQIAVACLVDEKCKNQMFYFNLCKNWLMNSAKILGRCSKDMGPYHFVPLCGALLNAVVKLFLQAPKWYQELKPSEIYQSWIALSHQLVSQHATVQRGTQILEVLYAHLSLIRKLFSDGFSRASSECTEPFLLGSCQTFIFFLIYPLFSKVGPSDVRLLLFAYNLIEVERKEGTRKEVLDDYQKQAEKAAERLTDPICFRSSSWLTGMTEFGDVIHYYCQYTHFFSFQKQLEKFLAKIDESISQILEELVLQLPQEEAGQRILLCIRQGFYLCTAFSRKRPGHKIIEKILNRLVKALPLLLREELESLKPDLVQLWTDIATIEMHLPGEGQRLTFYFSPEDYLRLKLAIKNQLQQNGSRQALALLAQFNTIKPHTPSKSEGKPSL